LDETDSERREECGALVQRPEDVVAIIQQREYLCTLGVRQLVADVNG